MFYSKIQKDTSFAIIIIIIYQDFVYHDNNILSDKRENKSTMNTTWL